MNRGEAYRDILETAQAIADYKQALEIRERLKQDGKLGDENDLASVFNNRGNLYKMLGNYELALDDIHMALSLNTNDGYAYSTMSEVYAADGNRHKFLSDIDLALQHGCPVWEFLEDKVYGNYLNDEDFLKLLQRYKGP